MEIYKLSKKNLFETFLERDSNGREISIFFLRNVTVLNDGFYPNVLLSSLGNIYNPINEKIMSLDGQILHRIDSFNKNYEKIENNPVFFFIYNTENYFHFVYDTLPYLISYLHLKREIKNLKLLMNYPNKEKNSFYKFVEEFLSILGIDLDILIVDNKTKYSEVYFSSSYTHDGFSDSPPREEIYSFYKYISSKVIEENEIEKNLPKRIYISRRTWVHNDFSNIGTNYTLRRKCINEDEIVEFLEKNGYVEIFTEKLTTKEKIQLFRNVESVVGAIGGGVCNVLFSRETTDLLTIVSPTFLSVNNRFINSLKKVRLNFFNDCTHHEISNWKKYMRIKTNGGIIGEIEEVHEEDLVISFTNQIVAGWNSETNYEKKIVSKNDCIKLDEGLNSPWSVNLPKFKIQFK